MGISEINREKSRKRWNRVHSAEERLIRDNKKGREYLKARIHGYLCGDGSVSMRKEKGRPGAVHADIRFYPDHESLIRPFMEAFCQIYGKKPTIRNRGSYYSLAVTSMTAARDILADGGITSTEWHVPGWVAGNKRNSREWLCAFFDCEAHVCKKDMRVQSVNPKGLRQIAEMLRKYGIRSREYSYRRKNKDWNTNYHLVIAKREDRKTFLSLIGLNHVDKLRKLANCQDDGTRLSCSSRKRVPQGIAGSNPAPGALASVAQW